MKTAFTILISLVFISFSYSQQLVSGTVTEKNGTAIIGANIFITGSYDGGITDENGKFAFNTTLEGVQELSISYLGFESKTLEASVGDMENITIELRESTQTLDAVEITASTFKAGDNSKVAVLKPLDIVTTAGSQGDVIAALQTLPGSQANPDDGRLMIRGGDASETKIYIDGLRVFSPYTRTVGGSPARGRYSPFLFKGISFNTGGYSSQFGQALSGILDLSTIDNPNQTETNISLMTVGLGIGHTQKFEKQSISVSASYIDLSAYYGLIKTRLELNKPFRGFSGEAVYRYNLKNGIIKSYLAGDYANIDLNFKDLDTNVFQNIGINNSNIYSNTTLNLVLSDKHSIFGGISVGMNNDNMDVDTIGLGTGLNGIHSRIALKSIVNDHFILNYGADLIYQSDKFNFSDVNDRLLFENQLDRNIAGLYLEADYFISKQLAFKPGLRIEKNSFSEAVDIMPRFTIAQKLSKYSQVSASYGQFRQEIDAEYLYDKGTSPVNSQLATHYLLNFNHKSDKQIIRLEGFYKQYNKLTSFNETQNEFQDLSINGEGYAYGAELFWRSNELIKYSDLWVSYGWLETQRKFNDYPDFARPSFGTQHNLSVVYKRWFEKLKSSLGLTYRFSTGRPFENPNTTGFMNELSKNYNSINFSWAYLISQQKILFISVSNATAFKNEFGYRYAENPDAFGTYPGQVIRPNEDQFFFVGFFMTISQDKKKNQLDTL